MQMCKVLLREAVCIYFSNLLAVNKYYHLVVKCFGLSLPRLLLVFTVLIH